MCANDMFAKFVGKFKLIEQNKTKKKARSKLKIKEI